MEKPKSIIKNNEIDTDDIRHDKQDDHEQDSEVKDEELIQINDYDEKNARNELLNYLEDEERNTNIERNNILKKYTNERVKGSNSFTTISDNQFGEQKTDLSKHFQNNIIEKHTFDGMGNKSNEFKVNTEGFSVSSGSNKKLFGNVEAFDDFDEAYANFEK